MVNDAGEEFPGFLFAGMISEIVEFEEYRQNIKLILEALLQGKAIRYSNRDRHGNLYSS